MTLDILLSTILLVSFLVTIVLAIGSYVAYKLREGRRGAAPTAFSAATPLFERVLDVDEAERAASPRRHALQDAASTAGTRSHAH